MEVGSPVLEGLREDDLSSPCATISVRSSIGGSDSVNLSTASITSSMTAAALR